METIKQWFLSFQLKVPVFFLVWALCGVLLPSVLLWTFNLPFNIGAMIFCLLGLLLR